MIQPRSGRFCFGCSLTSRAHLIPAGRGQIVAHAAPLTFAHPRGRVQEAFRVVNLQAEAGTRESGDRPVEAEGTQVGAATREKGSGGCSRRKKSAGGSWRQGNKGSASGSRWNVGQGGHQGKREWPLRSKKKSVKSSGESWRQGSAPAEAEKTRWKLPLGKKGVAVSADKKEACRVVHRQAEPEVSTAGQMSITLQLALRAIGNENSCAGPRRPVGFICCR